ATGRRSRPSTPTDSSCASSQTYDRMGKDGHAARWFAHQQESREFIRAQPTPGTSVLPRPSHTGNRGWKWISDGSTLISVGHTVGEGTMAREVWRFAVRLSLVACVATTVSLAKDKKKDPDEIGNRDVGKGVNFYSLEKEIALGKQMAQEVERQAKIIDD